MSAEPALALVLRSVDFSETSSVVTLLTRELGKVRALAKGARRPKGPFESALDLLSICRVVVIRKSAETLDLLTEAKLERRFRPPDRELSAWYAGYYVAELCDRLVDDHDPHPELFDRALEALSGLAAGRPWPAEVLRFEMQALRCLGHLPALDACAECGRPVALDSRTPFSYASGGLLCSVCRPGKAGVILLGAGTVKTLARFAEGGDSWTRLDPDAAQAPELRAAVNRYLWRHLGRKPTLAQFSDLLAK